MSNFQKQKKQSEYSTAILIDFFMQNGYDGKMSMDRKHITLSKKDRFVLVPYKKMLSESIVLNLLTDVGLESSDFGEYYQYLQTMDKVDELIGMSVGDN